MTDLRSLAIRFADLWAVDHHQMVDEIYAPSIHMESMARPGAVIDGAEALHTLEDELARRIPEHRHELVRVLVDGPRAFLETTVVGPTTGEYAQAAVWWVVDGEGPDGLGQVVHEVGWFDWDHRSHEPLRSRGSIPPDDRQARAPGWYEAFVTQLAAAWNVDPVRVVRDHLAPAATLTHVGFGETAGATAALTTVEQLVRGRTAIEVDVIDVLGEGGVVAALCTVTHESRQTRGTLVLTLNDHDAITSVRVYLDWGRAVELQETPAGSPRTRP